MKTRLLFGLLGVLFVLTSYAGYTYGADLATPGDGCAETWMGGFASVPRDCSYMEHFVVAIINFIFYLPVVFYFTLPLCLLMFLIYFFVGQVLQKRFSLSTTTYIILLSGLLLTILLIAIGFMVQKSLLKQKAEDVAAIASIREKIFAESTTTEFCERFLDGRWLEGLSKSAVRRARYRDAEFWGDCVRATLFTTEDLESCKHQLVAYNELKKEHRRMLLEPNDKDICSAVWDDLIRNSEYTQTNEQVLTPRSEQRRSLVGTVAELEYTNRSFLLELDNGEEVEVRFRDADYDWEPCFDPELEDFVSSLSVGERVLANGTIYFGPPAMLDICPGGLEFTNR